MWIEAAVTGEVEHINGLATGLVFQNLEDQGFPGIRTQVGSRAEEFADGKVE